MCGCFYTASAADTVHADDTPHFSPFIYVLSFFVLHERAAKKTTRQKKKEKTAVCSHLNISPNTMLSNTILAIVTKFRERFFTSTVFNPLSPSYCLSPLLNWAHTCIDMTCERLLTWGGLMSISSDLLHICTETMGNWIHTQA